MGQQQSLAALHKIPQGGFGSKGPTHCSEAVDKNITGSWSLCAPSFPYRRCLLRHRASIPAGFPQRPGTDIGLTKTDIRLTSTCPACDTHHERLCPACDADSG